MRWLPFILIFLLVYIESALFVRVASELGVLLTLLLVLFTSCIGISLVRSQGIKNFIQIQQKLINGESPAAEMIKSVSLLLAGFLLLLPGFFTDFLGLLLLLPPVQKTLVMKLMPHINIYRPHNSGGFRRDSNTFEGEYERKQDDPSRTLKDHKPDDDEHKPH
ncbi:FxsA family protein [Photorhabdus bodei]|uniref:Membrane protein FxsA n=1 Tax=Photorhabdus bodei TaxID=2029681 RepID=A0A329X7F2_9GAMM|nr:FxsA family protein [Photorhabdus bodei]NDL00917.1 membrane protein FxsA [Photorhabdus bodei]NDL05085.1 membrane protein FxsA [Photorhabdus bodei]NDL09402.1 membrane protein FxsA [Photorhabdus bodei]RAX11582.1 membrane protein FxsA [Photorhabdus bodei]